MTAAKTNDFIILWLVTSLCCFFLLQHLSYFPRPVTDAAVSLRLSLAPNASAELAPVFSVGNGKTSMGVFLKPLEQGRAVLGVYDASGNTALSHPFATVPGQNVPLDIRFNDVASLQHRAVVRIGGAPLLDVPVAPTRITDPATLIGENRFLRGILPQFPGTIAVLQAPRIQLATYPFGISPHILPVAILAAVLGTIFMALRHFLRGFSLSRPEWITLITCQCLFMGQLTDWTWILLYPDPALASFFDYQLQSLLQGHWDVPLFSISYEAFVYDDKFYGYFGPTPALLRLPVTLFQENYGQWTRLYICVYQAVSLVFLLAVVRQFWNILHPGSKESTPSPWYTCFFLLVYQFSTAAFFISSSASIYYEAIMAATMFTAMSLYWGCKFFQDGTSRAWVPALLLGTLAVLARVTLGAFSLMFLGMVVLWHLWHSLHPLKNRAWLRYGFIGIAILPSLLSLNFTLYSKFDTFEPPYYIHIQGNKERLDSTAGKAFFLENIPYSLYTYVINPLQLSKTYPYIFPHRNIPEEFPKARLWINKFSDTTSYDAIPGMIYSMSAALFLVGWTIIALKKSSAHVRMFCAACAVPFSILLCILLGTAFHSYRYINDISIPLALLTLPGISFIQNRRLLRGVVLALLLCSGIVNVCVTIRHTGTYFTSPQEFKDAYQERVVFLQKLFS